VHCSLRTAFWNQPDGSALTAAHNPGVSTWSCQTLLTLILAALIDLMYTRATHLIAADQRGPVTLIMGALDSNIPSFLDYTLLCMHVVDGRNWNTILD